MPLGRKKNENVKDYMGNFNYIWNIYSSDRKSITYTWKDVRIKDNEQIMSDLLWVSWVFFYVNLWYFNILKKITRWSFWVLNSNMTFNILFWSGTHFLSVYSPILLSVKWRCYYLSFALFYTDGNWLKATTVKDIKFYVELKHLNQGEKTSSPLTRPANLQE